VKYAAYYIGCRLDMQIACADFKLCTTARTQIKKHADLQRHAPRGSAAEIGGKFHCTSNLHIKNASVIDPLICGMAFSLEILQN
jgi:hypothetical protein